MKQIQRKAAILIIVMLICITCIHPTQSEAHTNTKSNYLVLVQIKNGTWLEYTDMIEAAESGNLMIQAKRITKALGFTYEKQDGLFEIRKSDSEYNSYTKESKLSTYTNKDNITNVTSADCALTSSISGYNLCSLSTLNTLVFYRCFSNIEIEKYSEYDGIVCISKYKEIPDVIPVDKCKPAKKAQPTPTPEPEAKSILVENVEFPLRDKYLSKVQDDWGSYAPLWSELELKVDGKLTPSTDLWYEKKMIGFSHQGKDGEGIYLKKIKETYTLSINVKLTGSVTANQNASIVKAMAATISSKPSQVYQAIYDSFTSDNSHGLNKEAYVKIGDCKIKVSVKDGVVNYLIKKA